MTHLVQALTHLAEDRPDTAEAARRVELERALRLLQCGTEPALVFEDMSRRLTNKLLHAPTKALGIRSSLEPA